MDYNSKLVAFGLSIWHYGFSLNDCVKMAWEGIQFIGKRLEGLRAKMQGWGKAHGGLKLRESTWIVLPYSQSRSDTCHKVRGWRKGQG